MQTQTVYICGKKGELSIKFFTEYITRRLTMKKFLILTACSSVPQPTQQQPTQQQSAATEPPAPATEAAAPTAVQTQPGSSIQQTAIPSNPPIKGGIKWGDYSTVSQTPGRALIGDNFTQGKFERPYNSNSMDVYFPQLDIDRLVLYPEDPTWVYVTITMVGRDKNNSFSGQYALELDPDQYGRGKYLVLVTNPASTDWTTSGVQVFTDTNGDVGGEKPVTADSAGASGNGYETVLFDQGTGSDPDLAWVRLDPASPKSFQIAFKQSILGSQKTYTAGFLAGAKLDPALFDFNDHIPYEDAGAAYSEIANFYPIKGLSELDNTCRQAIGFQPSGKEPGICPVQ
jgi:hypothetical protein